MNLPRNLKCLVAALFLPLCFATIAGADESIRQFIQSNCQDCHCGSDAQAGLDLESLSLDMADAQVQEHWIKVHDRVADGEMPPLEHEQPSDADRSDFLDVISEPLARAVLKQQKTTGRGLVRRLNRVEFETALSDLLGLPLMIRDQLPADGRQHGFDTVGAGLNVSSVQMETYLETLDAVLDDATVLYEQPERRTWKLDYRDTNGIMQEYRRTGPFHILPDGVVFFAPEKHAHLNAVLDHFTIPYSATYRVKVNAYAIRSTEPITLTVRTGGPGHSESDAVPKTLLGHVTVRVGDPQSFQFQQRLHRGQFFRIYPASLPYMRFIPQLEERQKDYQGPGVVIQSIEVEGPIIDQWPPKSHQQLWGGIKICPLPDAKPNEDPNEHLLHPPTAIAKPKLTRVKPNNRDKDGPVGQFKYDPKQNAGGEPIYKRARMPDSLHATHQFAPDDAKAEATRLLQRFVPLAYRREVKKSETDRFILLVHRWIDDGDDFQTAMRSGYKAVLTSPGFLYHQASLPTGTRQAESKLSDHALAERLSFFLWNSGPDEELRRMADSGSLANSDLLSQQVERLLDDPKSDRFVEDFLGQWLDLRLLDFTTPDSALYPEHDPVLQWSFAEESQRFFRELLTKDLSVANFIDSDFAMLNSRLARLYDVAGVDDMRFRKVSLPADSVRGGVLTQGSVLKVTANGTTTSPVVRGAWVLDRIIGKPANPPPPGTPAIEPDIRGATTVRQQLQQHRNVESCAACHKKIDPPGVALESFDVIGAWRDHYRAINPKTADIKDNFLPNVPLPIKHKPGLPVDASDELADGQRFEDIRQFKRLLLRDPDQIARNITEKLVIYSTGAPISFADRAEVQSILDRTGQSDHGLRSLIHAVIQSDLFRHK
ncbi:MAG: DUF1592 domain-containing protein [Pirellulaceae bacterium]